MKTYTHLAAGLVFAVGIFGAVAPLMATPDESQRLRGLEGRVFEVVVQNLTTGDPPFQNCYIFLEDGVLDRPGVSRAGNLGSAYQRGQHHLHRARRFLKYQPFSACCWSRRER